MHKIIKNIKYLGANLPGWRTNRKIVVFESDDWGSVRMPSIDTYQALLNKGIPLDKFAYNRYDSLASEDDLTALFEVLTSVKDSNGKPAILTANTIMANPDFEKIKAHNFQRYYYEPFTETLKRYPNHSGSFELWKEGISSGIFLPQFHGREHLNGMQWIDALQKDSGQIRLAFEHGMFDLTIDYKKNENSFMEALNGEMDNDFSLQKQFIVDGLRLFEQLFGYRSLTFIAPCYIWSDELNMTLFENGVKAFQGGWYQFEPIKSKQRRFKKKFHFTGQKNKLGQIYLTRNIAFEPAEINVSNWTREVLSKMNIAFKFKKPAIIQTHRINFIGYIDQQNRKNNLALFSQLLKEIIKRWPEVEFMSSDKLAELIIQGK